MVSKQVEWHIVIVLKLLGMIFLEAHIKIIEIVVLEIRCELFDEDNLS
jgi:hypothetical protein